MNSKHDPTETLKPFPQPNKLDSDKGVVIRPQLMLSAERKHCGMAIALFFLAKSANTHGWIERSELKSLADKAGMSKSSFYRGFHDAETAGLLTFRKTSRGKSHYVLASYETAYEIFESPSVDYQAVWVPFAVLFERGIAFVARIKAEFQNKPISQDTTRKVTGVPQATQRRWNTKHGVSRRRNIAITQYDGSLIYSMREYGQKNVFVYNGKIAKHIPSQSRVTKRSLKVVPICLRRVRTIRKNLASVAFYIGETSRPFKVFCETVAERDRVSKSYHTKRVSVEGNFLKLNTKNHSFGVWDYSVVS